MFKTTQTVKVLSTLLLASGIFSCSTDENNELTESDFESSQSSNQTASIDTSLTYTITSTTTPVVLSTSGFGRISDIAPTETTVRQLWRFTEGPIDGTYFIDNLDDDQSSRLTTTQGINALTLDSTSNTGSSATWLISPTGFGDFYFTNLRSSDFRRMTAFASIFGSSFGARTTDATDETDAERFTFTAFDLPSTGNRAPVTSISNASVAPFGTVTANVLSNDFDPDGDELSLVSFTNNDDRVVIQMVGNSLQVNFRSFSFEIIEVTYVVSDGNGATSTGVLRIGRSGRGSV